jgi:hypothetical protein
MANDFLGRVPCLLYHVLLVFISVGAPMHTSGRIVSGVSHMQL